MKLACALLAGALTAATAHAAEARKEPELTGGPGRYQMFQGKYPHWDADQQALSQKEDLFMIDTTNGQSWVYMSSQVAGKETRYWFPATYDEAASPLKNPEAAAYPPGTEGPQQ